MLPLTGPSFDLTKINVCVTNFESISGTKRKSGDGSPEGEGSPSMLKFVRRSSPAGSKEASATEKMVERDLPPDTDKNAACAASVETISLHRCEICHVKVRSCDVNFHKQYHQSYPPPTRSNRR